MNISDRTVNVLQRRMSTFQQSENADLDYTFNWATVLGTNTITSSTWVASSALSITPSNTDTTATAIINGNPGIYTLTNKITTSGGVTDERQIKLQIMVNDRDTFSEYI